MVRACLGEAQPWLGVGESHMDVRRVVRLQRAAVRGLPQFVGEQDEGRVVRCMAVPAWPAAFSLLFVWCLPH